MSTETHQAKLVWRERMTFDATTTAGHHLVLDAAKEHGGDERGAKPVELLLNALAGCTAMDVLSILQKKREPVAGLEVNVTAARATEHPKVYTDIEVVYRVRGQVNPQSIERAIELSTTKYCPAYAMLSKAARITTRYELI